jgi:hypothetical protein
MLRGRTSTLSRIVVPVVVNPAVPSNKALIKGISKLMYRGIPPMMEKRIHTKVHIKNGVLLVNEKRLHVLHKKNPIRIEPRRGNTKAFVVDKELVYSWSKTTTTRGNRKKKLSCSNKIPV